eukprot:6060277-Pyramimonas_sp.AAC.1
MAPACCPRGKTNNRSRASWDNGNSKSVLGLLRGSKRAVCSNCDNRRNEGGSQSHLPLSQLPLL